MQRVRENEIDGVAGIAVCGVGSLICLAVGLGSHQLGWLWGALIYGVLGGCFLHTTLVGKGVIWDRLLPQLDLSAQTQALDVGCGHGLVMLKIAERLPLGGHVTGIDIWRQQDQTHNSLQATTDRIAAADLTAQASVVTADMRDLPFRDQQFNLVVSSLAVHNVKPKTGRLESLQEMNRVLQPGGRLVIVDLGFTCQEYHEALRRLGFTDIRVTGNGYNGWWSGPWMPTLTLTARKPTP